MARKQSGISQQPYLNHDIKTQGQQARFLGSTPEQVRNLGHPSTVDRLTESPVGYPKDYEQGPAARVINEKRSVGVYQRFADPKDGRSTQQNLDRWADYARSNSYNVDGRGRDPKGRGEGSDNHLRSTKSWPNHEFGSESGPGRIEKTHSRKK
jgi:hypothetical protein